MNNHHPDGDNMGSDITRREQQQNESPAFRLDKSTLVPIGLLVAVVLSAISATVWINTYLLKLSHEVEKVQDRLAAVSTQMNAMHNGVWTLADQRAWSTLLAAKNSAIIVPEVIQVAR